MHEIGLIVFDEFHFIGDPSRGFATETIITRILLKQRRQQKETQENPQKINQEKQVIIQLVGLSATIAEASFRRLATWMSAIKLNPKAARPVIQYPFILSNMSIEEQNTILSRTLKNCANSRGFLKSPHPDQPAIHLKALSPLPTPKIKTEELNFKFLDSIFLKFCTETELTTVWPPTLVFFFSKVACVTASEHLIKMVQCTHDLLEKEVAELFKKTKRQKSQITNTQDTFEDYSQASHRGQALFRKRALLIRALQHESEDRNNNNTREWVEGPAGNPNLRNPIAIQAGIAVHTADLSGITLFSSLLDS